MTQHPGHFSHLALKTCRLIGLVVAAVLLVSQSLHAGDPDMVVATEVATTALHPPVDRLWILLSAMLVFIMQAGFLSLEVGFVQPKSVTSVAMKNVVDVVIVTLVFFAVGFGLMFGRSHLGIIGTDLFGLSGLKAAGNGLGYEFFLFQVGFCAAAATIVSGAMAGRTGFITYILVALTIGTIIYPVFGHWSWGNALHPDNNAWLANLGFIDFAGSTAVHSVGAWIALVGASMLGPRIGRLKADRSLAILDTPPYAYAWVALGVFLLWFGWWGFNGGSTLRFDDTVDLIILNTNLAAVAAGGAAFVHGWFTAQRSALNEKFLGGLLGGLVAITACCHLVSPLGALAVGATAGVVHNLGYEFIIKRLKIDDPVGAIPVHGCCGIWGTLCVALFGNLTSFPHNHTRIEQLGVQCLGVVVCMAWTVGTSWIVFRILRATVGLRVAPEAELAGISINEIYPSQTPAMENAELDEATLRELMGS